MISLPTTTFPSVESIFDGKLYSEDYVPMPIGESEVNYGWSGKGGSAVGNTQRLPSGAVYADEGETDVRRTHRRR